MKAYELLDSPEKWCQGTLAEDLAGGTVPSFSEHAVRWCMLGAITRVYLSQPDKYTRQKCLLVRRVRVLGYGSVEAWNDDVNRTYEEVHSLLKSLDI